MFVHLGVQIVYKAVVCKFNAPPRFTHWNETVTIALEAGFALGTVWMNAKNIASTGIRFPNRANVATDYTDYAISALNSI